MKELFKNYKSPLALRLVKPLSSSLSDFSKPIASPASPARVPLIYIQEYDL